MKRQKGKRKDVQKDAMKEKEEIARLRKAIKKLQSKKRYEHTLGVEFTAASLAMRYGASIRDARLAGLLHDCTKCLSEEKQLAYCKKHAISITETERRNPFLLHAKTGAWLAAEKYGIQNDEIINAIRYHTTGRPQMSLLEKILFVADYIEPNRTTAPVADLKEIRHLAFVDLDQAVRWILKGTLEYLKTSGKEIDTTTEVTYAYYYESL